jgi:hypothetical protein
VDPDVIEGSLQIFFAGAVVSLRNENTGVRAQQVTNASGQYLFDFVLPGTYTVTVELQGFKQFVQRNVLVQARGT